MNKMSKHTIRFLFAAFWSLVTAGYMLGITFFEVPKDNQGTVNTVLGFVLGTVVATVMGFYFGSSQGSADKSEQLNKDR
jgi:uncharacterized PurR-regulated membrane protein YhhQ (DUF165 family)